MTTKAEALEYFGHLDQYSFSEVSIGSYALEFLPSVIQLAEKARFSNLLSLGCGHADELIACRMFFGDDIKLTGVDNNHELTRGNSQKELQNNLCLADAQFLSMSMLNIDKVLDASDQPDIIVIRHPGRLHDHFDQIAKRLEPWVNYSAKNRITTLLSFFDWHEEETHRFKEEVIQQHIDASNIQLVSKIMEKARGYHDVSRAHTMYPDFYGIRLF